MATGIEPSQQIIGIRFAHGVTKIADSLMSR